MRGRLKALPPGWDFWTSIASSRNGALAPHAPPKRRTHMSDDRASESLAYYASHGPITDPALHAAAFAGLPADIRALTRAVQGDRKSTRLNSSHGYISYAVFCLKKKINQVHERE